MKMTAAYHATHAAHRARSTMELLADPYAPARAYAAEHPQFADDRVADLCFTVGYLAATLGSLLDVMGYPEHGPNLNQHSWLPEDDEP